MEILPREVDYYSYADDSYVVVHNKDLNQAVSDLERVIVDHVDQLTSVGMIVNNAKTEVIQFLPGSNRIESVNVGGDSVPVLDKFKVLGLTFDSKLCWKAHIDNLKKKLTTANNGVKLIRRKLDAKQTLVVVTAQALSILYYGAAVWLTPGLAKSQ